MRPRDAASLHRRGGSAAPAQPHHTARCEAMPLSGRRDAGGAPLIGQCGERFASSRCAERMRPGGGVAEPQSSAPARPDARPGVADGPSGSPPVNRAGRPSGRATRRSGQSVGRSDDRPSGPGNRAGLARSVGLAASLPPCVSAPDDGLPPVSRVRRRRAFPELATASPSMGRSRR